MTTNEEEHEKRGDREGLPPGELRVDDRGQDEVREAAEESIASGLSRPLSREEREAAKHDSGAAKTVYAPASERVPKPPAPGDEKLISQNTEQQPSTEEQPSREKENT